MFKSRLVVKLVLILLLLLTTLLPAYAAIYTYDDLNRLTSVTYNDGLQIDYTYDAGGNLFSVTSTTPSIEVHAVDSVTVNNQFNVDVILHGANNITAEDFTITYDTTRFELVSIQSINSGLYISYQEENPTGTIRFIVVILGDTNTLNDDVIILNLTFKAKTTTGFGDITATNVLIADGNGTELTVDPHTKSVEVVNN